MPKGRYINFAALEEMYGTEVVEALRRQMEIEADRIVQDMKSRVPVRTGRLRDSILGGGTRIRRQSKFWRMRQIQRTV